MSDVKGIWEAYLSVYEQAPVSPTPQPVVKPVAKAAPKPKVSDPSTGVDKDKYDRWKGQAIGIGKELEPERTEVTPGKKGPDPNLPAGLANPNKNKDGVEIASSEYPADDWNADDELLLKWLQQGGLPNTEKDIEELLRRKNKSQAQGFGSPKTQIAGSQSGPRGTGGKSAGDPTNIKWPRDRPGGARPGPGYVPPLA